ncbi:MAG: CBS domain-containing protein [Saprospiraceae bacterium]|nr:CBS domain-containing protein [Saprospiraceae bacterium]
MGSFAITQIENLSQRNVFYRQIFEDIEAFDRLLAEGAIDKNDQTFGVEQELCFINHLGEPENVALKVLEQLKEPQFTNELALFNMEINLDPQSIKGKGIQKMADQLYHLTEKAGKAARKVDSAIFLAGILPTITSEHLTFDSMTPVDRYKVLSQELLKLRGKKFEIFLQGVDELHVKLDTILFEACNTSFQMHLQINPDKFAHYYNWAQMISGPLLSVCTNSPLLFGKELWSENRIALFKQSLDTRIHYNHYREKVSRVYFGDQWLRESPSYLWKNEVARFPLVFRGEGFPAAKDEIKEGLKPSLRSVRLHTGTTYTWNRLCYGVDRNQAHIRIECRYIPAGPTIKDEIANLVFWLGLMKAAKYQEEDIFDKTNFSSVKNNFYQAARYGILSEFDFFGKNLPAVVLCENTLIPLASRALKEEGMDPDLVDKHLKVIADRVTKNQTGATWMVENHRKLLSRFKPSLISKILVTTSLEYQKKDVPVSEWQPIVEDKLHYFFQQHFDALTAKDVMSNKIQTVSTEATVAFAFHIMEWQDFRHLVVEDNKDRFIGLVCRSDIEQHQDSEESIIQFIHEGVKLVETTTPLTEIQNYLAEAPDKAVIVIRNLKTVGIITENDL